MSAFGTVVVTGATGFIGSALVRRLGAEGARVVCPVRAASPRAERIAGVKGVEVVRLAVLDRESLRRELGGLRCEVVLHLAAYGVDPGERDPVLMVESNAGLTAHVLAACLDWSPRRFVFAGSCSEYAPAPEGQRISEDHPLAPSTLYGAAKMAAHSYGAALARHLGIDFVGLRMFGTFGLGEAPYRLIQYVIDRLLRGEEPELTPGEHRRDLTYVDDVIEALLIAATSPELAPGLAYNVCTGIPRRIADVVRRTAELLGLPDAPLGLGRRPHRPDEPSWVVGDPTRFSRATGWAPKVSLDDGILRMIEASHARA